ncbi:hypothetical protein ACQR1I_36010 [Bradyrhizobium sp. HKCCYLS2038]|uniref:hypothetical protein n=1 Tax=Bradyrhizobium sp. HKCCYLS2038 TaxID=3420764 RepID=UPI003EBE79AA
MTPFASVALFRRDGATVFKAPRKEPSGHKTQARKSASRFWRGNIGGADVLTKIVLVQQSGSAIQIAERATVNGQDRPWVEYRLDHAEALKAPHLAACLAELGVDPSAAPPAMPDVLEINGVIYRREI